MISWFFCLMPFLAAAVMILGWPLAPDNDLYFHLRAGERVAATAAPLLNDLFTYTVPGRADEAWHSWISQLIFWKVYSRHGFAGLQLLNVALVWITLAALVSFVAVRTKSAGATLLAGTIAVLLHRHSQILRPLLFGETLFAVTVFWILRYEKSLTAGRMVAAIFLAVLWANLHASVVILPVIFLAYAVGSWLERGHRQLSIFTVVSPFLVFGATLLNPRHVGLYTYSYELTKVGKIAGNMEWGRAELFSLTNVLGSPPLLSLNLDVSSVTLLLGLVACAFLLARGAWAATLLCLLFLALPFVSVRHVTYLLFPLAIFFGEAVRGSGAQDLLPGRRGLLRPLVPLLASLVLLLGYRFQESPDVTPSLKRSSDFIEQAGLRGNIFCDPAWSSYLLFRHYPDVRVATDNRTLVNEAFYRKARTLYEKFGNHAWRIMIDEAPEETDFILLSSWRETPPYDLNRWLVVYENNHATLAVRKNERNAENLRRISDYYAKNGVPFAGQEGFSSLASFEANPAWFRSQLESMPWGRWPQEAVKRLWETKQKSFYESRKIIGKNPLG